MSPRAYMSHEWIRVDTKDHPLAEDAWKCVVCSAYARCLIKPSPSELIYVMSMGEYPLIRTLTCDEYIISTIMES